MDDRWISDVVRFWFGQPDEKWWKADPAFDAEVREHFLKLWEAKRELPADCFLGHAMTALAAVTLFDQSLATCFVAMPTSSQPITWPSPLPHGRSTKGSTTNWPSANAASCTCPFSTASGWPTRRDRCNYSPPWAMISNSDLLKSTMTSSLGSAVSRIATSCSAGRRGPTRLPPATSFHGEWKSVGRRRHGPMLQCSTLRRGKRRFARSFQGMIR